MTWWGSLVRVQSRLPIPNKPPIHGGFSLARRALTLPRRGRYFHQPIPATPSPTNVLPIQPPCRPLAALALALLVTGCAAPGEAPPPARLTEVDQLDLGKAFPDGGAAPAAPWWAELGDPQLARWVARAVEGSPSLRIAQARLQQAQAAAGIARAAELPTVNGTGDFTLNRFTESEFIPPPYAGHHEWDNKILAQARFDLDLWGRNRSLNAAALDTARAAQAEAIAARLSLQTAVVRTYLQLALSHALRDIAEATLAQQQQILDITQRRYRAGLGTQLEVSEAQTPLPTTRALIEQINDAIARQRNEIAALAGAGPGDAAGIAPPQIDLGRTTPLPDVIPAHWLGRRPDLIAQRWRVEAAGQSVRAARASFYPDINLGAFAGVQSLGFTQLLDGSSFLAGVGPAISLPIFNGGRLRAELGASTAAYDVAVETYNQTLIAALTQTANLIASVRSLDVQIDETRQALVSADRAYNLALTGYRAGLTEYLSVLNAQSRRLEEQRRLAQLQAQRLDAQTALYEALAGGMEGSPSP
ncbi:MAG: efflux transporter outer membrane subunit [Nevskiaceae bacterium]|nr:MAG: efflux transporter outer membrane subunit [Nevskiaceae bacterium]